MATGSGKVIWIVNHYAGSRLHGMEYRHYCLAQHFQRLGLRPVIICAAYHHLLTKRPEGRRGDVDGIPYVWIKTCRYEKNDLKRVLNMVEFSCRLALKRLRALPPPEVVIASSPHPFVAFNGRRLAKRYQARFIFEVRDLWPLTILEVGGHSPRHPLVRAMARAERLAYERCDHTVSLLGGAREYMTAHGLDAKKFVYIPNGIDLEASRGSDALPREHAEIIRDVKEQCALLVLYSGNHGVVNALETVVEAAGLLKDEPGVHFLLVGQGPEKARLQERARQMDLANVTFLPPVAKSQMPALTQAADIGYIGLQRQDLFKYGVSPNKLFEYMAARLPVIFAIDTDYDEVAQAHCGFSIGAEDPPALANVLRRIVGMSRAELRDMGNRAYEYVRNTHTYDVLARQYMSLF